MYVLHINEFIPFIIFFSLIFTVSLFMFDYLVMYLFKNFKFYRHSISILIS